MAHIRHTASLAFLSIVSAAAASPGEGDVLATDIAFMEDKKALVDRFVRDKRLLAYRASRAVMEKIDFTRAGPGSAYVRNVWNGEKMAIVERITLAEAPAACEASSETGRFLDTLASTISERHYHFPTHRVSLFEGADKIVEFTVSWENDTACVSLPYADHAVYQFDGRDARFLQWVERRLPLTEWEKSIVGKGHGASNPPGGRPADRFENQAFTLAVSVFHEHLTRRAENSWILAALDGTEILALVNGELISPDSIGDVMKVFATGPGLEGEARPARESHYRHKLQADLMRWGGAGHMVLRYGDSGSFRCELRHDGKDWIVAESPPQ